MERKLVVFDLDDTLFDFNRAVRDAARHYLKLDLKYNDFKTYEHIKGDTITWNKIVDLLHEHDIQNKLDLIEDEFKVHSFICDLMEKGYTFAISTSRLCYGTESKVKRGLKRLFSHLKVALFKDMNFSCIEVAHKGHKLNKFNLEEVKIFVDDCEDNLLPLTGKGIELYLINRPWNRKCKHPEIKRIKSIFDIKI